MGMLAVSVFCVVVAPAGAVLVVVVVEDVCAPAERTESNRRATAKLGFVCLIMGHRFLLDQMSQWGRRMADARADVKECRATRSITFLQVGLYLARERVHRSGVGHLQKFPVQVSFGNVEAEADGF